MIHNQHHHIRTRWPLLASEAAAAACLSNTWCSINRSEIDADYTSTFTDADSDYVSILTDADYVSTLTDADSMCKHSLIFHQPQLILLLIITIIENHLGDCG